MNNSLRSIGIDTPFTENILMDDKVLWMDEEVYASASTDFFVKKPIDYAKKNKSFNEEDLF